MPEEFAHGFVVLSEIAEFLYKSTDYYAPEFERSIVWNDPSIAINWVINSGSILYAKDQLAKTLTTAEHFA